MRKSLANKQRNAASEWVNQTASSDWGALAPSDGAWGCGEAVPAPSAAAPSAQAADIPSMPVTQEAQPEDASHHRDKLCKRMRNLRRVLREIQDLLERKKSGAVLLSEQEVKIQRQRQILAECEALGHEIASLTPAISHDQSSLVKGDAYSAPVQEQAHEIEAYAERDIAPAGPGEIPGHAPTNSLLAEPPQEKPSLFENLPTTTAEHGIPKAEPTASRSSAGHAHWQATRESWVRGGEESATA